MKAPQFRRGIRQSLGRTLLGVIALLLGGTSVVFAAGGDVDMTFDPGMGADSDVRAVVIQPDGKILIGGDFTKYGFPTPTFETPRISRINPDGTWDGTFYGGSGADNTVFAIALQSDGKIIIGGAFANYQGAARKGIARLHPNGSLDTTFVPGTGTTGGDVRGIVIMPDDKIVIVGTFTGYNGTGRNRIARLNTDGSLDMTFDPGTGASGNVFAVARRPDGDLVIGGAFSSYNTAPRGRIARLNANGTIDTSFTTVAGADFTVLALAVQPDNKTIIGGLFNFYDNVGRNGIARVNSDGSLDTTFDPGTGATNAGDFPSVHVLALQPDGKVVLGSSFTKYNGVARSSIARANTNGSLDSSFDPGTGVNTSSFVYGIGLQSDGKIVIGGTFISYNGVTRNRVARLLPAPGAISFSASTHSVNEDAGAATITLTRTGGTDNFVSAKVTLSDQTTTPADYLFAPGSLDLSFDVGTGVAQRSVDAIAIQPDGKLLIGGDFLVYNGVSQIGIARLNSDGSFDTTFQPGNSIGINSEVDAIAVLPDGRILIGGRFATYQGVSSNNIARLNANASRDTSFVPGIGAEDDVLSIVIASDGKIIVGGDFTGYDTHLSPGIARLTSNGSFDPTFNVIEGMSNAVRGVAISEGKILVAGDFFRYNQVSRNAIARLNVDGSLDTTFNPGTGANDDAYAVAVQADGKILLGGEFTNYNGTARNYIARINPDGSLDMTFDPGMGANSHVRAIFVQPDGKIVIGGFFDTYDGVARKGIARLNPNGSLDPTFDPGTGLFGHIRAMAVQGDGNIVLGGAFTTYNDVSRASVARAKGDLFVTWPAGDLTNKSIQLPIVNDSLMEGSETLTLTLTSLNGGATAGAVPTQTLTIIDNDTPSPTPTATPGLVSNVSTRLPVGTGNNVLIEGFIVLGPNGSSKKIMVRAIGPSLLPFGIPDALPNPTLEIRDANNALLATNNDWRNTQVGGIITSDQSAEISSSGLAPGNDLESAIIANLAPGSYTAVVRGFGDTSGTGVVDAYDLSAMSPARLANIATRGLIQPGDKLMIAGFIVQDGPVRAVLVATGPSLGAFGISNALPDTTLQLRNQNGTLVQENDDWQSDQKTELESTGLQPSDSKEAAMVLTIQPGQYTAQVRGKPEATGIGVIQVFFLQ